VQIVETFVDANTIYRGTSRIRNCFLLGPYSRPVPDPMVVLGGLTFLMSEVPLFSPPRKPQQIKYPPPPHSNLVRVKKCYTHEGLYLRGWGFL